MRREKDSDCDRVYIAFSSRGNGKLLEARFWVLQSRRYLDGPSFLFEICYLNLATGKATEIVEVRPNCQAIPTCGLRPSGNRNAYTAIEKLYGHYLSASESA